MVCVIKLHDRKVQKCNSHYVTLLVVQKPEQNCFNPSDSEVERRTVEFCERRTFIKCDGVRLIFTPCDQNLKFRDKFIMVSRWNKNSDEIGGNDWVISQTKKNAYEDQTEIFVSTYEREFGLP